MESLQKLGLGDDVGAAKQGLDMAQRAKRWANAACPQLGVL